MPPKPNYRFERAERERAKAAKKAKREEKKRQRAEGAASDDALPDAGAAAPERQGEGDS